MSAEARSAIDETLLAAIADGAAERDRTASFPFDNFRRLQEAGLLGLTVPERYGGQGLGIAAASAALRQIAGADASTALILAMHYINHGNLAEAAASLPAGYERAARAAVAEGALLNALRAEPDLGTPARGGLPATTAQAAKGGWVISGRKIYVTGSPALRWLLIWCRTADDEPRVGAWLVPARVEGVSVVETWDHLGMRATGSHDVIFQDVFVPADHALDVRAPAAWAPPDARRMAWVVLPLVALYLGIAEAARVWLVDYLRRRRPTNLGTALAELPRVQEAVGRIDAELLAASATLDQMIRRLDGPSPVTTEELGLAKWVITGSAIRAVEAALQLVGNAGLSRQHPLERHYRDVLCSRIHTPQDDTILLAAGRAAFAL